MPVLDLRTVIVVTSVMGMLMSLVLFFLRSSYPRSIRGMRYWAIGPMAASASSVLFTLHPLIPLKLGLVLANLVLLGGVDCMVEGTYRHFGLLRARWVRVVPIVGLGLPGMLWWTQITPSYPHRVVLISSLLAMYFACMTWVLFRHARQHFPGRYTMLVSLGLAAVMLLRLGTAGELPTDTTLFVNSLFQNIYIMSMSSGILLLSIGFVLLSTKALQSELESLATHDSLTGTLTRRALFTQGEMELARVRRTGEPLSVLMMDLDHFKSVNDTYGHLIGDAVLRDFVRRVEAQQRKTDLFGRYGGEEFVLLLPNTDLAQARIVAHRILDSRSSDARLPLCTVSIGVATHQHAADRMSLEALINQADNALYQAKNKGRNRLEVAPAGTTDPSLGGNTQLT